MTGFSGWCFILIWSGPWIDVDGVRDEDSLTIPTDRDVIGELEGEYG